MDEFKKPEDVIRAILKLSKSEYKILNNLVKLKNPQTVKKISSRLRLDRSTVQKALIKLTRLKVVKRKEVSLRLGGFKYTYESESKNKIKKMLTTLLNKWTNNVKSKLKNW